MVEEPVEPDENLVIDDSAQEQLSTGRVAPREDLNYDTDTSASVTDSLTWISWFCSLAGHEYFAEVAEDFIEDDFNLTGLTTYVPFYKEALEMILDVEPEDDSVKVPEVSLVESSAEILYGLIHQRYIMTRQGLSQMNAKYESAHFGYCPRVYCQPSKVVPCGRSDTPGDGEVVLFCPNCMDIYHPPSSRYHCIDGAYFGTSFPHLLFQTFRESPSILVPWPPASLSSPEPPCDLQSKSGFMTDSVTTYNSAQSKIYGPRIYGFRVSERARSGPRMQWLRIRPGTEEQLRLGLEYREREQVEEIEGS
ncbi:hypothetical protein PtA15_8A249 [Puccinia triticina]|uniref:Casein kinase II subunit beta n=2 Tax=Puccinia triticina TaxID=208348 RepID=A0ABY7CRN0_9BASI|nr:uncharacterized protein PtA15_8A249 [Puccinia triticina]WAQ87345.1 hypothetical protein PtA15_8A249 [Puccinia triticina]WAR57197.1 hypothetical protein PtB15_8B244 [Puccinia triticina]